MAAAQQLERRLEPPEMPFDSVEAALFMYVETPEYYPQRVRRDVIDVAIREVRRSNLPHECVQMILARLPRAEMVTAATFCAAAREVRDEMAWRAFGFEI